MFILWPYSMGNVIAGECCGDIPFLDGSPQLADGVVSRQVWFKFGSKFKQCIPLIEFRGLYQGILLRVV